MTIQLTPLMTLKQFQDVFHATFPFLRIDFFAHTHLTGQGSISRDKLNSDLTFAEAGKLDHKEGFEISGAMKVKELEMLFQERFKVGAQVLRKSSKAWILTIQTDDWTLRKENETGREDSVE